MLPRLPKLLNEWGLSAERAARIGPVEWPGKHVIEILDERQQFVPEVLDRFEVAPADDLAHDHTENYLDLVQPGTVLGRVYEPDSMTQIGQKLLPALHRLQHP